MYAVERGDLAIRTLTDAPPRKHDKQHSIVAIESAESLWRRIRRTIEVVVEAESAIAAGDICKATPLWRDADRSYIAILSELTRLSGQEAELVEPAFTELEVGVHRVSHTLALTSIRTGSV